MKVLMVGELDFASVGFRLAEALKRKGHEATVVTQLAQRWGLPSDKVVSLGYSKQEYVKELNSADLIMSISGYYAYRPFSLPFPRDTPTAIWNGGTNYRQNHLAYEEKILPFYDFCYTHWDLQPLSERNNLLNAPVDTDKYKYILRRSFGNNGFVVGHIPSSPQKGTEIFREAVKELRDENPNKKFNVEILSDISHAESMRCKRKYHVYFDQILQQPIPPPARHPYGVALVEAASLGAVCICGTDMGENWPIGRCFTKDHIKGLLIPFIDGEFELWEGISRATRQWAEDFHSYDAVVNQFMEPLRGKI
jgi:glycosyltransferase involved in cell wall biosynthesis